MAGDKFLARVSLNEARRLAVGCTALTEVEQVAAEGSLGRVTSAPVFAHFSSPHYRASAMDGIAVRSVDLVGSGRIELQELADDGVAPATGVPVCTPVDTGSPMPDWADAVVRIENTRKTDSGYVADEGVTAGRDVRRIGEDVDAGSLLLARGHRIRPYDIGAMLATGVASVAVRRRPRVGMLATGAEIVEPGAAPQPGKIIEYNSRVMAGYVQEWGGKPVYLGKVADDREQLARALLSAASDHDIVCVIAGSSAGSKDITVDVIRSHGRVLAHGIDMMPGKPASISVIGDRPVIGIPGYPVSAVVAYQQLLAPVLAAAQGIEAERPATCVATVRRKISSRLGVEEFVRVCLARCDDGYIVTALPRGAGSITTLVRADGILRIAVGLEGIDAGTSVEVELLRPFSELAHSVVVAAVPDALAATLEDVAGRRLGSLRFAHLALSPYDALASMRRGEIELAILATADGQEETELSKLQSELVGEVDAFSIHPRGSTKRYRVILSRALVTREAGATLLAVLGDNSFGLELETIQGFESGLSIRRFDY